jgi:hypothetical protein
MLNPVAAAVATTHKSDVKKQIQGVIFHRVQKISSRDRFLGDSFFDQF